MAMYAAKLRKEGIDNDTITLNGRGKIQASGGVRVYSSASAASLTPNPNIYDQYNRTAQAVNLTINNPATNSDGQKLIIRVLDDGTGRTLTFGTQYRGISSSLPSTTTASKTLYMGFIFNEADTKWDMVSSAAES